MLTQASLQAYLDAGGVRCLYCGADTIDGGAVEIDAGAASQFVTCLNCRRSCRDCYRLTGVAAEDSCEATACEAPAPDPAQTHVPPDLLIVVERGRVDGVYGPAALRYRLIDFDELADRGTFDPDAFEHPDAPLTDADAQRALRRAVQLTQRSELGVNDEF